MNGEPTKARVTNFIRRLARLRDASSTNKRIAVTAAMATAGVGVILSFSLAATTTATNITIDGTAAGPAFQGVGAISTAGNSRLLIDYPESERSQVLDYLFKPDYGASLQMLKLEIGSDANSTDGADSSVEHTQGQLDCNSGYEWWIGEQALARNPNIKLYGLQWGAPGWVSNDGTIWTQSDVNYVISWLNCAKSHNLPISYIGGWNERYDSTAPAIQWYKNMRAALNANGYSSVQIVAADKDPFNYSVSSAYNPAYAWQVGNDMSKDSTLNSAISVLGAHDTCAYPTLGYTCEATSTARSLGKPLWESEIGAMDGNTGSADMVRSINNGYNQAGITGYLEWPLIDSLASGLPLQNRGLLFADQPWSGQYQVNLMTWAIAQTTQFVQPGWLHVNGANKSIGNSGTYNTYEAPDHSAWSMVAENTSSSSNVSVSPQTINVTVKGGLPSSTVHVWETNLWNGSSSGWFLKQADIHPANGAFSYTIPAGYVVTFTTTTGQSKGDATGAAASSMSLPYTATQDDSNEPWDLSSQDGAFEYAPCQGGISGSCIEQMTPQAPLWWSKSTHEARYPYGVVGDGDWTNYTVNSGVLFTKTGSTAGLIGRFSNQSGGGNTERFNGYQFNLNDNGAWRLYKNSSANGATTLKSGSVANIGDGSWHTMSLKFFGATITASIDGKAVATVTDGSYATGLAGIASWWTPTQFNNFAVTPATATGPVTSVMSSSICLDDSDNGTADGNKVDIYACNNSGAQQWTIADNGEIQINGKCLDDPGFASVNNTKLNIWDCVGGTNEQWHVSTSGQLVSAANGKCVDDPASNKTNGTQVDLYTCVSGAKNEQWQLP